MVSTYKEPIEAWVDNFYGPTGVVAGTTSGLIRTMLVADIPANMVPVDMCISGLIAATWDISKQGCVRYIHKTMNYKSCKLLRKFGGYFAQSASKKLEHPIENCFIFFFLVKRKTYKFTITYRAPTIHCVGTNFAN